MGLFSRGIKDCREGGWSRGWINEQPPHGALREKNGNKHISLCWDVDGLMFLDFFTMCARVCALLKCVLSTPLTRLSAGSDSVVLKGDWCPQWSFLLYQLFCLSYSIDFTVWPPLSLLTSHPHPALIPLWTLSVLLPNPLLPTRIHTYTSAITLVKWPWIKVLYRSS